MNASRNIKLGALAVTAVALVAAGGAFAAGKYHGSKASAASLSNGAYVSSATSHAARSHGPGRGPNDDFAAAATYLGLSQSDLQTALQSGKTLAQVANATSGKSSAGLIEALVAAEQTKLAAAVTAGKLTQAQADQITPMLKARFTDLVNGVRPDRGFGGHDGPPSGGTPAPSQAGTHI